jgi:site-specific DNA recombinase
VKTAAIYARVSSERQKEEQTIKSQTAALLEYAQCEGYIVPQEWIFEDEGYSGANLVRPGLERIRDLAAEGQLETILVHSPDRLSRKYAYQVLLLEEFSRHGAEVIFLKSVRGNTPEEQLLLQFQGMIAEYERAQIIERSRRGKRHKAQCGSVNVLSGAPYGYRYVKKTDSSCAYYEILEKESEVVREIFRYYTQEGLSINAIARRLNNMDIPTRSGKCLWERSTIWGMLRNPAYKGLASFGKTEQCDRQKVTRQLRQRGGYSPRCSSSRRRPKEEWIQIPVPAVVSEETFAMAEELLERNKRLSKRRTKEPTLLQGLLVCKECGYALYRSSTRTSKHKIYYYRCIGSDNYRHAGGRVCSCSPIRQDYLDEVVWNQVVRLLENPDLIEKEINRRIEESAYSSVTERRKEVLMKELTRVQKGIDKLLDAYQEDIIPLAELRKRIPVLRKRETAIKKELQGIHMRLIDHRRLLTLTENMESFLRRLRESAETLNVPERQKVVRLVVKEVIVGSDKITIKHSIPIQGSEGGSNIQSYLLRKGSHQPINVQSLSALRVR